MGADGGSVQKRKDIVKKRKQKQVCHDRQEQAIGVLTRDAITGKPLNFSEKVSACNLGLLYNKETALIRLLNKRMPDCFDYIKRVSDLIDVRFTFDDSNCNSSSSSSSSSSSTLMPNVVCPILSVQLTPMHPFVVARQCGCAFSSRALRELGADSPGRCLVCQTRWPDVDDVQSAYIHLNPSDEQRAVQRQVMLDSKEKKKKKKKKKKKRKSRAKRASKDNSDDRHAKRQRI
jgi:replication termination factor 2